MDYCFGEWQFNAEYLLMYKKNCSKEELNRAYEMLESQRNRILIDKLLKKGTCIECTNAGSWNPIGICITYSCNLRCNYCGYSSEANLSTPVDMDTIETFLNEVVKRYLVSKKLKKVNAPLILFLSGGGEPTYEWNQLKEIIFYFEHLCKSHSIKSYINLTTNGLLNDTQIDFLAQHVQEIMVSYDGLPNLQNNNRPSAYGKPTNIIVENTIMKFSTKNLKLIVRSTLWPENYKNMLEMYSYISSMIINEKFFTWSVNPVANEGRATECEYHTPERSFVSYYRDLIDNIIHTYGEESVKHLESPFITNNYSRLYCGSINGRQPWLLPNGDVILCIESPSYKNVIARIENGKMEYFKQGDDSIATFIRSQVERCKGCIAVGFCNGGCPVWFTRCRDTDIDPPECSAQREYCHILIKALIDGDYSFGWKLKPIDGFDSESIRIMVKK